MGRDFASALNRYIHTKTKKLNKKTEEKINKALHKLGAETRDKIKDYINNEWYGTYDPKDYVSQLGLRDSVVYVVDESRHKVRVYFDMRILRGKTLNGGEGWQAHRDFSTRNDAGEYVAGADFTTGLINWIETGKGGGSIKNPRRNDGGIHMIQRTREWLNSYLDKETRKIVGEILKESGLAR